MQEAEQQKQTAGVAWQHREFRIYSAARFLAVAGGEAQAVAVAWQVYQITHSALALGYTGLALFLPGIFFVLPAGHTADIFDRRTIVMCCYSVQFIASALLLHLSLQTHVNIWAVYAVLFIIGIGRCFSGPAMSALLPTIVPKDHFVNAVTWGATVFQVSNAVGPMIGGFLFTIPLMRWSRTPLDIFITEHLVGMKMPHRFVPYSPGHPVLLSNGSGFGTLEGAPIVYCFTLVCLLLYLILFSRIHPRGAAEKKGFTIQTMLAGLRYVAHTRLLLGSISLDLFAVLFGGAVSLMPIFASDVLHSGAHGLGLLRAMPSMGALLVSLLLVVVPLKRKAGSTMLVCVAMFGAATVVFGLSRNIWLSCFALFIVGATDMVSVVVRSSILQLATPPEMRGRVSSVNWLFLGASNEFGEYESGLTAHWWGAVRAVVVGGIASMTVTGLWSIFFPALRRVDKLTAEDLIAAEKLLSTSEPVD